MKSAQQQTSTRQRESANVLASDRAIVRSSVPRTGFTLVELLMVILVIGILVSMLAVAINPVLNRARETSINTEMSNIALAIENFENKYGFYPPSFSGFAKVASDPLDPHASDAAALARSNHLQLLPFLNKLSPTHLESIPITLTGWPVGVTRLQVWWVKIGRHLDDRSSLVFWLNGLANNKQFPFTHGGQLPIQGGELALPVTWNANSAFLAENGSASTVQPTAVPLDREDSFDLKSGQIKQERFDAATNSFIPLPDGVAVYNQPFGNQKRDLAYRYRNAAFYDLGAPNNSVSNPVDNDDPTSSARSGDAYYVRVAPFGSQTRTGQVFLNPTSFQLTSFGLDGVAAAAPINRVDNVAPTSFVSNNDNIANFANGRIDSFDWSEAVELNNRNPQ